MFSQNLREDVVSWIDAKTALLQYNLKSQLCAKLYKLMLFKEILFPEDVLNEDEFTTYRLAYECDRIGFTSAKLYYYYQHGDSIMDNIAKKLKASPHKYDWLYMYVDRIEFFEAKNEQEQVLKTYEKICVDIILRNTEQLHIKKLERDPAVNKGEYIRTYRFFYKKMIHRKGMPLKRKFIYTLFYIMPVSALIGEKFIPLRK